MFRSIPVANKLCFDKELKRSWEIHENKLKHLKCSIDRSKPSEFGFLQSRPKKEVLREFRDAEVLRENRVLLNKISEISVEGSFGKLMRRMGASTSKAKKTLNEPYRKRELVKIVEENQEMLKRIQQRKSCYNNRKMAREREKVERNINLISSFPYKDMNHNKTLVNLWVTNCTYSDQTRQASNNESTDDFRREMLRPQTLNGLELKLKRTRTINGQFFLVSSRLDSEGRFLVELQNLEKIEDKYCLSLTEAEARNFMKTYFGNSLECMLNSVFIDEKEQVCYLKYQVPQPTDRNRLPKIKEGHHNEQTTSEVAKESVQTPQSAPAEQPQPEAQQILEAQKPIEEASESFEKQSLIAEQAPPLVEPS